MTDPSQAQAPSQTAVDEQKRTADYWEAVKRETDAKKAIADAQAAIANAESAARVALAKAETEADKAKLEYLKGQLPSIPDPTKYKLANPTAPTVAASASRMTFDEASKLAESVASMLNAALQSLTASPPQLAPASVPSPAAGAPAAVGPSSAVTLLPDDARTRTLIALSRALREMLDQANTRLANEGNNLDDKAAQRPIQTLSPMFLPAVSALGEVVLSYATILRTQYGFATVSQTALAEAVLRAKVFGTLATTRNIDLIDPDAIVAVTPPSGAALPELDKLKALQNTIADVRKKLRAASAKVDVLRSPAASLPDNEKKAALKLADEIEVMARQVAGAVDEVNKMLATLYVADPQGNTPLDSALRGGILDDKLQNSPASYMLSLKVAASDIDTIAANRFFSGMHVSVASNTVVHWRLASLDGVVRASGAGRESSPLEKVQLP